MINLGHGANVDDMAAKYHKDPKDILDFSANINPYTVENLETYILEGLSKSYNYPDIHYTQLKKNIAQYLGCSPAYIIPGNGATEIMYLLMKCIKGPLAIINPTFSEYERSARLNGIKIIDFYLHKQNTFTLDLEVIQKRIDDFESLFICNPNNPTGKVQDIQALLDLLTSYNKQLIVDETFIEFVEDEAKYSLLKLIQDHSNLIIIKAATKFFGLPGVRLGYGITSNQYLLKEMAMYKEPWTINCFAEVLANHIFEAEHYIHTTKSYFKKERERMLAALNESSFFRTYPTDANFILLELKGITAEELKQRLFVRYNLLIRDASNFKGLDKYFIRIAIKTPKNNDLLISKLKDEGLFKL
ncbi:pyridoxal phosphate-dependent aminotransferase [Cellulosilyticum sp. I15G10I2]|uniref:pyridoxal phosphate-dependent aminotransferase n=1 Tax=Cellulosilyticum sp. I15G10I2 TaxID=1892843 RepID=UPI0009F28A09|nr:threonine-phosphate decarboxylase [Cellulosilyticum sp. I15G10I2]